MDSSLSLLNLFMGLWAQYEVHKENENGPFLAMLNGVLGDYLFDSKSPLATEMAFIQPPEPLKVNKIVDHADVPCNVEQAEGFRFQVVRHGRHPVAFVDAKLYNRFVRPVVAHQRDVGAVQSGHHRHIMPLGDENFLG